MMFCASFMMGSVFAFVETEIFFSHEKVNKLNPIITATDVVLATLLKTVVAKVNRDCCVGLIFPPDHVATGQ